MIFNPVVQSGGGECTPAWVDEELAGQQSGKYMIYRLDIPKPEIWTSLMVIFWGLGIEAVCAFTTAFSNGETYTNGMYGGIAVPEFIESSNSLTAKLEIMGGRSVIGVKYLLI